MNLQEQISRMKSMMGVINESEYNDIYDPNHYLEDLKFFYQDVNHYEPEEETLEKIQMSIDEVKEIKDSLPLKIYRGIDTKSPMESQYNNSCWSTDKRISENAGNKIFVGIISDPKYIDWEETIRTRTMFPHEQEINIPNSEGVEIIDTYYR
jgi:hypothetical protein